MSQRYIGGLIYNPPGGYSGYFDGSGDYLDAGTNAAFALGSGDFTLEAWVLTVPDGTSVQEICTYDNATRSTNADSAFGLETYADNTGAFYYTKNGTSTAVSMTFTASLNAWHHIAVARSGSNWAVWVDGVRSASQTAADTINAPSSPTLKIGRESSTNPTRDFSGYISNLRLVKGTAVYDPTSTTIVAPSGPLQAITNTSLLTCAYSTFRDGSTNNFTITVNGNTAVSTQNPFPLNTLPNPALGNQGNGVYSMSQYQSLKQQGLWPAIDPYWRYVTMMLHGNGTNGAQNNTFLDSSTNNFTITRNGNTTQGTFSPYGSNWGNFFSSSNTDWINFAASSSLAFAGDFTVEAWIYNNYSTGTFTAAVLYDSSSNAISSFEFNNGTYYPSIAGITATNTVNRSNLTGATLPSLQWNHVAFVRSSGVLKVYINGIAGATTLSNSTTTGQFIQVANARTSGNSWNGYISNLRMVSSAVYTSNFTPPTTPLTAISGTQLLTCQSNRFVDNSSNALAPTLVGSPSVQRFSPFSPTAPYAAGVIGGSGYFDGSGDYLTAANNAAFRIGSGDFTIECWVYLTSLSNSQSFISLFNTNGTNPGYTLYKNGSTNKVEFYANGGTPYLISTPALTIGQWTHVAVVRNGSSMVMYMNGASVATATNSSFTDETSNPLYIGARADALSVTAVSGYIADARIVKGTAVYTAAFTPPTAPLTAITNTSLLTNFTNAGIIDNAEMNDLETVGNAQISTAQSKFGGGSIYLDGTGDWLISPASPNLVANGDFTVEAWVYMPVNSGAQTIISYANTSGQTQWSLFVGNLTSGKASFYWVNTSPTGYNATSTTTIPTGQWVHLAGTLQGTTLRIFVNGVLEGTGTISGSARSQSSPLLFVGQSGAGAETFTGYIDDLRITKGYARYTSSFTPQRSQWQDQ